MTPHSTIDPQEAAYFASLAARWWDPDGPFWPLHRLNGLRTRFVRDALVDGMMPDGTVEQPLKGLRIVDLGCGGGLLSEAMATLGATVHGVDVVRKNIEIARLHAQDSKLNLHYEVAAAEVLALRGDQYDVLLNMEVVEHVAELKLFMDACATLVRPGGMMIVATINRTLASWLGAIVAAEYVMGWLPKGTHQWRRFPTDIEMENLLGDRGFRVTARTGVVMNPFTRKFHLSGYKGINYMLVAQKPAHQLAV